MCIHICASLAPQPERTRTPTRVAYWRPSRPRIPRADYLASVAVTDEHKRQLRRAKQARYRARQKAAAS